VRNPRLARANLLHVPARAGLHSLETLEDVGVHAGLEHGLDGRQEVAYERRSPCVPAQEVAAAVVVRPVEHGPGEEAQEPAEQRLMAHVHPDDDHRTPSIDPEVALADQEAGDEPALGETRRTDRFP
jgi:hypothetical protein